jgi:hypothetical protein
MPPTEAGIHRAQGVAATAPFVFGAKSKNSSLQLLQGQQPHGHSSALTAEIQVALPLSLSPSQIGACYSCPISQESPFPRTGGDLFTSLHGMPADCHFAQKKPTPHLPDLGNRLLKRSDQGRGSIRLRRHNKVRVSQSSRTTPSLISQKAIAVAATARYGVAKTVDFIQGTCIQGKSTPPVRGLKSG